MIFKGVQHFLSLFSVCNIFIVYFILSSCAWNQLCVGHISRVFRLFLFLLCVHYIVYEMYGLSA
jgi:hypothetical protein